jgi:hypothetical protein
MTSLDPNHPTGSPETLGNAEQHEAHLEAESHQPPAGGFFVPEGKQRRVPRWLIPVAAVGLAGLAGGAVVVMGQGESGGDKVEAYTPSPDEIQERTTTTARPTTTTTESPVEARENDPRMEPVFITADTPEGIIEQYEHNKNCAINAWTYQDQVKCVTYFVGDLADAGAVPNSTLDTIDAVNEYRRFEDEDFILDVNVELVENSSFTNNSFIAVIHQTDSNGGDSYQRLYFTKSQSYAELLTSREQNVHMWVLYKYEAVGPSEIDR